MKIFKNQVHLIKYAFVGAASTFLDIFIFWFCIKIFMLHWFFSTTVSFLIVSVFGFYFYLNHVFTSNSKKNNINRLYFFLFANVFALIINQFILYIGIELFSLEAIYLKIFASLIIIFLNYIVRVKWIFT